MKKLLIYFVFVSITVKLSTLIVSCSSKEPSQPNFGPLPTETGNILVGKTVKFTSTNADKKGESLKWKVKGAPVGTGKTLDYLFDTEGTFKVELAISTNSGTRFDYHDYTVVKSITSNTTSSSCYIGVWTMTAPGCKKVSTQTISSNKTATLNDWTCDGSINRIVTWTWNESNGFIDWHYTSYKVGGTDVYTPSTMPKDEHTSYTCTGNTFVSGGVTWHK